MLRSLRIASPMLIVDASGLVCTMDAGGLVCTIDAGGLACTIDAGGLVLTEPSLETLFARVSPVLLT